jgi:gamma-glutamyl hydrolase
MHLSLAVALAQLLLPSSSYPIPPATNNFPTIGILSVPNPAGSPCDTATSTSASCFATFYPQWVSAAGARAVILPVDAPLPVLDALLDSVNGVLLTGGSLENLTWTNPYMVTAQYIYTAVLRKNGNGTFFPLHGTCQGMQVLCLLTSQDQSVLSYGAYDAEGLVIPLDISWDGHHSGRLFNVQSAPEAVVTALGTDSSTINLHHDGVPVDAFESSTPLSAFYILTSTNFDRQGKAFVSTLEAWDYPITATQWHPERNALEWRDSIAASAHTPSAVKAMQYMGTYFVDDARRNNQSFTDAALLSKYSVLSYPVVSAPDAAQSGYQWVVYTD